MCLLHILVGFQLILFKFPIFDNFQFTNLYIFSPHFILFFSVSSIEPESFNSSPPSNICMFSLLPAVALLMSYYWWTYGVMYTLVYCLLDFYLSFTFSVHMLSTFPSVLWHISEFFHAFQNLFISPGFFWKK